MQYDQAETTGFARRRAVDHRREATAGVLESRFDAINCATFWIGDEVFAWRAETVRIMLFLITGTLARFTSS